MVDTQAANSRSDHERSPESPSDSTPIRALIPKMSREPSPDFRAGDQQREPSDRRAEEAGKQPTSAEPAQISKELSAADAISRTLLFRCCASIVLFLNNAAS